MSKRLSYVTAVFGLCLSNVYCDGGDSETFAAPEVSAIEAVEIVERARLAAEGRRKPHHVGAHPVRDLRRHRAAQRGVIDDGVIAVADRLAS